MISDVTDIDARVQAGHALTREEAGRLLGAADLIAIGSLGEAARTMLTGDRVTYGRVASWPLLPGEAVALAGEIRIASNPDSLADACGLARDAAERRVPAGEAGAAGAAEGRASERRVFVTGFTLARIVELAGPAPGALAAAARRLAAAGLDGVAEVALDDAASIDGTAAAVRALREGGLSVLRLTVTRAASLDDRLALIERAAALQQAAGGFRAFAPLPRVDSADAPSTGYDDVRTIAVARLMVRDIALVQVDWPLYGPKLAQVAIAYGANDIDGVSTIEDPALGSRRSPREDIERQIRAASAAPAERDGRFDALA